MAQRTLEARFVQHRGTSRGGDERAASPSSAAQSPSFLVGLGHRGSAVEHHLEALVGDRLSTLEPEGRQFRPQGAARPARLRRVVLADPPAASFSSSRQWVSPEVTYVEHIRFGRSALVPVDEPGEIALDPLPFGGEKLTGSSRIHGLSVACRPPQRRAAEGHDDEHPVVEALSGAFRRQGRVAGSSPSSARADEHDVPERRVAEGTSLASCAVISDTGGRTYPGQKIFVDGGPTCSRTSASRRRPSRRSQRADRRRLRRASVGW